MIVPYLPLIFLMVVMFGQPLNRCIERSATGVTFDRHHPQQLSAAQRPTRASASCAGPTPIAASLRGTRTTAPIDKKASLQKGAVPLPAARPPVGPDRTIPNRVAAAMTVARRLTAASGAAGRNVTALPLVVLVMVRPEIVTPSDLTGKAVAIDAAQPPTIEEVRIALDRAGATGAKVASGRTGAVVRLSKGEVTAAVLGLVSPDAAESFPEISGYRIIRIPIAR
ncbi:MAG: hypothetical protein DI543_04070 [Bradyrhizobium icense]|jgi:hypothetical protein|nr:MAG: hypothetical protein DI543_04070 [Bradyrhizobium icense]